MSEKLDSRPDKPIPESSRLENRRRALKQMGALSGWTALTVLCGPGLKAAVDDLAHLHQQQESPASPVPSGSVYKPLATGTTPKAFTAEDLDLLGELVELIIPTTDTPGARAAGVHWYIDRVAEVVADLREDFSAGLAWLRQFSREQFGQPFHALTEGQQVELLTRASRLPQDSPGNRFFALVRRWTIDGYYKSEIGLLQELEWVGNEYLQTFPGCPHGDSSHGTGHHSALRHRSRTSGSASS